MVVDYRSKVAVPFGHDPHGGLNPLDHDVEVTACRFLLLMEAGFDCGPESAHLLADFIESFVDVRKREARGCTCSSRH